MRSSCPEPKRSGGATVRPVLSTTARAVRLQRSENSADEMLPQIKSSTRKSVLLLDGGASLADRESSLDLIKLDISRTFPPLFIFQKVTQTSTPLLFFISWSKCCLIHHFLCHSLIWFCSAGWSLPWPPPQRARGLHLLPTWHRLCEFFFSPAQSWRSAAWDSWSVQVVLCLLCTALWVFTFIKYCCSAGGFNRTSLLILEHTVLLVKVTHSIFKFPQQNLNRSRAGWWQKNYIRICLK